MNEKVISSLEGGARLRNVTGKEVGTVARREFGMDIRRDKARLQSIPTALRELGIDVRAGDQPGTVLKVLHDAHSKEDSTNGRYLLHKSVVGEVLAIGEDSLTIRDGTRTAEVSFVSIASISTSSHEERIAWLASSREKQQHSDGRHDKLYLYHSPETALKESAFGYHLVLSEKVSGLGGLKTDVVFQAFGTETIEGKQVPVVYAVPLAVRRLSAKYPYLAQIAGSRIVIPLELIVDARTPFLVKVETA